MSQQFTQPSRQSRRQHGLSPYPPNAHATPMSPDPLQIPSIVNTINTSGSIRTRTDRSSPNNLNTQLQYSLQFNQTPPNLQHTIAVSDASLSQYNSHHYPNIHHPQYRNHPHSSDSTISTIDKIHQQPNAHSYPN